jgi:ribosomal protein S6
LEEVHLKIYEGMFVLDDARANEQWDAVANEVRGLLEKNQAEVFSCERWDERRLAYPIQGHTRAVYLLARFTAPGDAISALERDCSLNETILRLLIVRDIKNEKLYKKGLYDPRADAKAPQEAEPEAEAESAQPEAAAEAPKPDAEPQAPPEAAEPAEAEAPAVVVPEATPAEDAEAPEPEAVPEAAEPEAQSDEGTDEPEGSGDETPTQS